MRLIFVQLIAWDQLSRILIKSCNRKAITINYYLRFLGSIELINYVTFNKKKFLEVSISISSFRTFVCRWSDRRRAVSGSCRLSRIAILCAIAAAHACLHRERTGISSLPQALSLHFTSGKHCAHNCVHLLLRLRRRRLNFYLSADWQAFSSHHTRSV